MLIKMRWRFIGAAMASFTAVIIVLLVGINIWNYRSVTQQQDNMLESLLQAERDGKPLPGGEPGGVTSDQSGDAQEDESDQNVQANKENEAVQDTQVNKEEEPAQNTRMNENNQTSQTDEKNDSDHPGQKGRDNQFSQEVRYMIRYFSVWYDETGAVFKVNKTFIASFDEDEAQSYAGEALSKGRTRGYLNGYRYLVQQITATVEGTKAEYTVVLLLNSERELHNIRSILLITGAIAGGCLLLVFGLVVLFSRHVILPYQRNLETQKQFITNAGHELKTPLTAIATSADVLAMEYENDEWVQNIQQQSTRMSKLISGMVTLSRLDEENPFPERAEFSLSDAVWEAAEPFVSLALAKGKHYIREIADDVRITGDVVAIQQMVSILLDNALKYSTEGGSIALCLAQKAGRRAELTVSNTCRLEAGVDVSRLFDRFYRGDLSHSGKVGGNGIGLSIAKATAQAHGGSIQAAWDKDKGVITFRVILPTK